MVNTGFMTVIPATLCANDQSFEDHKVALDGGFWGGVGDSRNAFMDRTAPIAANHSNAYLNGWHAYDNVLGGFFGILCSGGLTNNTAASAMRGATVTEELDSLPNILYHYGNVPPEVAFNEGLRPGPSGRIFLTPNGNLKCRRS